MDRRVEKHRNMKNTGILQVSKCKIEDYKTQESCRNCRLDKTQENTGKVSRFYALESKKEVGVDVQIRMELSHRNPIHRILVVPFI